MFSTQCKLHLSKVKMTRWEHFRHAINISWRLQKASIAVLIHALAPRFFETTASDTCKKIIEENS